MYTGQPNNSSCDSMSEIERELLREERRIAREVNNKNKKRLNRHARKAEKSKRTKTKQS